MRLNAPSSAHGYGFAMLLQFKFCQISLAAKKVFCQLLREFQNLFIFQIVQISCGLASSPSCERPGRHKTVKKFIVVWRVSSEDCIENSLTPFRPTAAAKVSDGTMTVFINVDMPMSVVFKSGGFVAHKMMKLGSTLPLRLWDVTRKFILADWLLKQKASDAVGVSGWLSLIGLRTKFRHIAPTHEEYHPNTQDMQRSRGWFWHWSNPG